MTDAGTAAGDDAALLDVRGLSVAYGRVEAVHDVHLQVHAGRIVTVIGPNGAGKTTLLAALMGLLPARGTVYYGAGEAAAGTDVEALVERGYALVPETRALFAEMSVEDNLLLGAYSRHRRGLRDHEATRARVYDTFPRLAQRRRQLAGSLSGGERQMLAMGRALMARPRLLMLDEPSLGLAPIVVREIFQVVARLREQGVALLLVEQNARAALQVADYGYVLESGEIALEGPSARLADDPRVIESYLGLGASRSTSDAQTPPIHDRQGGCA